MKGTKSKALEFIYRLTADRISQKIKEIGMPYEDIFSSDPKILSCIVNCKRTDKNKFLVPDRVFVDYKNRDGLIPKLFFPEEGGKSTIPANKLRIYKCEILWGKEEEHLGYGKELFKRIVVDLYHSDNNQEYADIFCAFVPYAKASTYNQIIFSESNKYPAVLYGVREDDIIEPEKYLPGAAEFLYYEIKEQYEKALIEYTNERDTFRKLEKDFFDTFVNEKLIPILKEYIEREHPLGLRVRELIQGELARVPTMLDGTMDKKKQEYYRALNRATTDYFLALEDIQAQKHK